MKRVLMLGTLMLQAFLGFACDQCGCGLVQGVQPFDHANNFGLQWRMRYLDGDVFSAQEPSLVKHAGHAVAQPTAAHYAEMYAALEARAQVWIGQRFNLTAAVPLVNNFQAVDNIRHANIYAMGDPLLLARYVVLGSSCGPDSTKARHRFTVGLGAKLPVGRSDIDQFGQELDHDLQPGTGTWDGLASLEYTMRGRKWGASIGTMGRYNGVSADGHHMGHSASTTAEVFRIIPIRKVQFLPSVGGYLETALCDENAGVVDRGTGGAVLFTHVSSRVWWRSFGLSLTWQHALLQDQGAQMIPNRERVLAGITYNFNTH